MGSAYIHHPDRSRAALRGLKRAASLRLLRPSAGRRNPALASAARRFSRSRRPAKPCGS